MIVSVGIYGYTTYGFRVKKSDRDNFKPFKCICLKLPGKSKELEIKIPPSFWNKCHELTHPEIGKWLHERELTDWPYGNPPKFNLVHVEDNHFEIK